MKRRVLFICSANSARSLMAEALLSELAGDAFEVASAGTTPEAPHPMALRALRDAGLPTKGLRSKALNEVSSPHWDYVIMLCEKATRECGAVIPTAQHIAWDFADPVVTGHQSAFARTLQQLRERISLFVMVHQKTTGVRAPSYDPVTVFKSLGDESRLAMMVLIREHQELCVCELTTALDVPQPKVSRHLASLREAGLLEAERRGQWIYYRLHPLLPPWLSRVLDQAADAAAVQFTAEQQRLAAMPDRPLKTDCA